MKKNLTVLLLALVILLTSCKNNSVTTGDDEPPARPLPFRDITAAELVADIRIGWNLGDALDSFYLIGTDRNPPVFTLESRYNNPTTKANIDVIRNAGFNAIRIPVSWYKAIDGDYNIREDWMRRVTEVVNFAVLNNMYIIINSHHDESLFNLSDKDMKQVEQSFKKIWEQIAEQFKNYNEKLIFEALNTPAVSDENLNILNQIFVDTVRASGGNNDKRFLIITPYDISETAMNTLSIPNDSAKSNIIVGLSGFLPESFTKNPGGGWSASWSEEFDDYTADIINALNLAESLFVNNGIPVIIKEFSALNRRNNDSRIAWAEFFVSQASERGIPCFWWDDGNVNVTTSNKYGFGLLNRITNEISHQDIIDALMKASE
jgi:endoglucanase